MSQNCQEALQCGPEDLRTALPIHTKKITDSCRDKDCIEDLRVYLTKDSQCILDNASGAVVRSAELIYTAIDVTPVAFNRNQFCIDLTFYYRIVADATMGTNRPATLVGMAQFSKRAVLCGGHSGTHIFRSDCCEGSGILPTAVVEVLDPMVLSSKVVGICTQDSAVVPLPSAVQQYFDDELILSGDRQRLFVTLGQFSIIRLERDAQLVVPVLEYSIPTKECCDNPGCAEDPCQVFARIPFPTDSFSPTSCHQIGGCDCGQET